MICIFEKNKRMRVPSEEGGAFAAGRRLPASHLPQTSGNRFLPKTVLDGSGDKFFELSC